MSKSEIQNKLYPGRYETFYAEPGVSEGSTPSMQGFDRSAYEKPSEKKEEASGREAQPKCDLHPESELPA